MMDIQIGDDFLYMGNSEVRLEKENPAFTADFFQGEWTFPFDIPLTDHNLRVLGLFNRTDVANRKTEFDCNLFLFKSLYRPGKLIVIASADKKIKLKVSGGLKALKTADTPLNKLDLGPDYLLGYDKISMMTSIKQISQIGDYRQYGFTFVPFYNPGFYRDNSAFNGVVNRLNSDTGDFLYNTTITGNQYCVVPFVFLFHVLSKIFLAEGLTPDGTFWNDTEWQTALLYNNYALDGPNETSNTYVIQDQKQSFTNTGRIKFRKGYKDSFDYANAWSNTNAEYVIQQTGTHTVDVDMQVDLGSNLFYDGVYFVPKFQIKINGVTIWEFYCEKSEPGTTQRALTSFQFNATSGNIGQKITVEYVHNHPGVTTPYAYPVLTIEPDSNLLIVNTTLQQINEYCRTVKFTNHVNEWTVAELLTEIKKLGVDFIFDYTSGTVTLNFIEKYARVPEAVDITDQASNELEMSFEDKNKGFKFSFEFPDEDEYTKNNFITVDPSKIKRSCISSEDLPYPSAAGDILFIKSLNQFYVAKQDSILNMKWEYMTDNYYTQTTGNGETEISCRLAPMLMGTHFNEASSLAFQTALMPHINAPGTSTMFGQGINSFQPRLLFYRGMNRSNARPYFAGGIYPLASTTLYGINFNQVGEIEFAPDSENGVWLKMIKPFLDFIDASEAVEQYFRFDIRQIFTLDLSKQYIVNSSAYMIRTASIYLSNKIKPTLLKMLRIS